MKSPVSLVDAACRGYFRTSGGKCTCMAQGMKDDIITEGVSIGNMSSEEVDAFLSKIVAEDDRSAKGGKKDSNTTRNSSSEVKGVVPGKTTAASPDKAASAIDVENTLDQVDAQLADLEAMLAEATDGEIDLSVPEEKEAEPQPAPVSKSEVAEIQNAAPASTASVPPHQDSVVDTIDPRESLEAEATSAPDVESVIEEAISEELPQASPTESKAREETTLSEEPDAVVEQAPEKTIEDPSTVSAEHSEPVRRNRLRSLPNYLVRIASKLLIQILTIVDLPFARLGRGIKDLIGYVAIATFLVAAVTWMAGTYLQASS